MKKIKGNKRIWEMIDFIHPYHSTSFKPKVRCSDSKPFNRGNFGCKRCDLIIYVEQQKNTILVA